MRIALVHDFLIQHGGAERVLSALHSIWPEAPVYTLLADTRRAPRMVGDAAVHPSFLQRIPFQTRLYKWFLPWMPTAIERHDLSEYDVVVSSSSAFAKGVLTNPNTLHLCYCHTPTRYLWSDTHSYVADLSSGNTMKRILPFFLSNLRLWDHMSAQRVDHFVANSTTVARRIQKYYRRESSVIHPPVPVKQFAPRPPETRGSYYLIGGRLVSYKRYDIAVTAFNKLGIPLVVFGVGPEEERLRMMAKPHIRFLGNVTDHQLRMLYRDAIAFLYPQEEDFGLTAVEAMAAGCPVIAYERGGARETIVADTTGRFFEEQTWESLADAVLHFRPADFDSRVIHEHARQFDTDVFKTKMRGFVEERWAAFSKR